MPDKVLRLRPAPDTHPLQSPSVVMNIRRSRNSFRLSEPNLTLALLAA
jgi:hypothetical protein